MWSCQKVGTWDTHVQNFGVFGHSRHLHWLRLCHSARYMPTDTANNTDVMISCVMTITAIRIPSTSELCQRRSLCVVAWGWGSATLEPLANYVRMAKQRDKLGGDFRTASTAVCLFLNRQLKSGGRIFKKFGEQVDCGSQKSVLNFDRLGTMVQIRVSAPADSR